jgi:hypothetical protein
MLIEHNHDAKRRVSKSNVVSYVVLLVPPWSSIVGYGYHLCVSLARKPQDNATQIRA